MHGFETPAHNGLTHVLDKGLGPRVWEDVLETSGAFIDVVKLGWGTAYVTQNLHRKLDVLHAAGKPVVIGGTFLEAGVVQDKVDEYQSWISDLRMQHLEDPDRRPRLPARRQ